MRIEDPEIKSIMRWHIHICQIIRMKDAYFSINKSFFCWAFHLFHFSFSIFEKFLYSQFYLRYQTCIFAPDINECQYLIIYTCSSVSWKKYKDSTYRSRALGRGSLLSRYWFQVYDNCQYRFLWKKGLLVHLPNEHSLKAYYVPDPNITKK